MIAQKKRKIHQKLQCSDQPTTPGDEVHSNIKEGKTKFEDTKQKQKSQYLTNGKKSETKKRKFCQNCNITGG